MASTLLLYSGTLFHHMLFLYVILLLKALATVLSEYLLAIVAFLYCYRALTYSGIQLLASRLAC